MMFGARATFSKSLVSYLLFVSASGPPHFLGLLVFVFRDH